MVPVRVEEENKNSVNKWVLLYAGRKESFLAKPTADKLTLRVESLESSVGSLVVPLWETQSQQTARVGKVDLVILPMEGPEGSRIQTKDAKVVENLHVRLKKKFCSPSK